MIGDQTEHSFQVDLRGLVDLLSHHLYASPRVFVRELLQNAVDAITARRVAEPGCVGRIELTTDGQVLTVQDNGIGLTLADVHQFLATIGRSSKRDEVAGVEVARQEFLGQFGIGLLACFVVADEIEVLTRSAVQSQEPAVRWLAAADGSYTVSLLADDRATGTTVRLAARPGAQSWFAPARLVELARDFGSLLPYEIVVRSVAPEPAGAWTISDAPPIWRREFPSPAQRTSALLRYGEQTLGFAPMDVVELDVSLAGLRGAAYILPSAVNPADRGHHRVYLKGMLLSDSVAALLPEWAFFARCVVDTDTLRPTASREGLYEDETLAAVREALGSRLRDWLTDLAATEPERVARLVSVHSLSIKALARFDAELLEVMAEYLSVDTTDGPVSLAAFVRAHPLIHIAATVDEFRQIAPVAAAAGLAVLNGGYVYDAELAQQLARLRPGSTVVALEPDAVLAHLDYVDAEAELALAGLLTVARTRLAQYSCDVVLRAFHPVSLATVYLDSPQAGWERSRAQALSEADGLWARILADVRSDAPRAQLILNQRSPIVRRLGSLTRPELLGSAVEALFGQALLMANRPLRTSETALLNRAFGELLDWATRPDSPNREEALS